MAYKYFRLQKLSPEQQILSMRKHFPDFSFGRKKGAIIWTGHLQPTPASEIYEIMIAYDVPEWPKVSVLSPELAKRTDAKRIPHTYPGNYLCLYLPKAREWSRDMLISRTIVPWTSLWLYYYEMWHSTGLWLGGGVHPRGNKEKKEGE
jgi:hypothetical protein